MDKHQRERVLFFGDMIMRYLGLDIGTTTITAVVLDVDRGEVVTVQSAVNDAEVTSVEDKQKGRSEWDGERMIQVAFGVMKQAVDVSGAVDGIGVTGQMHGMLLVGSDGMSVGSFVGWQDRRGMDVGVGEETYVGQMRRVSEEMGAFARGCRPHPGYLGTTLFWLAQQNTLSDGVMASFVPDYAVARLTGMRPVTDATNAAGSGLFDGVDRVWRVDLIEALGLAVDRLPEVCESGMRAGAVTQAVADVTGLKVGTPVCVACGDNQASFLGSVGDLDNSVLVNVGTGGQVSVHVSDARPTDELEARPFVDGGFLLVGAGLVGGRSYAWLRDFLRDVGKTFFGGTGDEDLYEVMNRLASDVVPGSDGLFCEPLFTGTRREPDRRGVWTGVGTSNFSPGHMGRALLEGLTDQFFQLYGEMDRMGVGGRTKLIGAGNGIRKNALLRSILEDRFGMVMQVPVHREEAAFGAALMGAVSGGEDMTGVGEMIRYV
jgi:sugar (pentulose or hexulose) kinase